MPRPRRLRSCRRNKDRKETTSRGSPVTSPGTTNGKIFCGSAASGAICRQGDNGCPDTGRNQRTAFNGSSAIGPMPHSPKSGISPSPPRLLKSVRTLMHHRPTMSGCRDAGFGTRTDMHGAQVTGIKCNRIGIGYRPITPGRPAAICSLTATMITRWHVVASCLHRSISIRMSTLVQATLIRLRQ